MCQVNSYPCVKSGIGSGVMIAGGEPQKPCVKVGRQKTGRHAVYIVSEAVIAFEIREIKTERHSGFIGKCQRRIAVDCKIALTGGSGIIIPVVKEFVRTVHKCET